MHVQTHILSPSTLISLMMTYPGDESGRAHHPAEGEPFPAPETSSPIPPASVSDPKGVSDEPPVEDDDDQYEESDGADDDDDDFVPPEGEGEDEDDPD